MIKTIDDFLPAWLWYWIAASKDEYDYHCVDSCERGSKHEAMLGDRINTSIREAYEDRVGKVQGQFYCSIVRAEPGYWYPDHADHSTKIVSSVVYLWPDDGDGTQFADHADVTWQTNRLVTWVNDGQVHSYRNTRNEDRYTLNLYQTAGDSRLSVVETKPRHTATRNRLRA